MTDGGCRDNPGAGSWAFVIRGAEGVNKGYSGFLPNCTNNQAEYRALEAACITLILEGEIPAETSVEIFSDSQLIVEQINGRWRVKDEGLRPYFDSAYKAFHTLCTRCPTTLKWFPREKNTEADALCNQVMDKRGIVCSKKGKRIGDV